MKAKRYPNLYVLDWTPNWVFRKYSTERKKEFIASTGVPATEPNAARAYKIGLEKFDKWLGIRLPEGRQVLIRDLARVVLISKQRKDEDTYRKAKYEIERHIVPAWGHLAPHQITGSLLIQYEHDEREKGVRTSFFNTRKYLREILHRAREEKLIDSVPKWTLSDPKPEAPRFIDVATFRRVRRRMRGAEKLIAFLLYYQGPRPREVLHYRWEMFDWSSKPATITIPGEIAKTRRARSIPLNSRVDRALRPRRRAAGYVFPGRDPERPRAVYDREWLRVVPELGLDFMVYNLRDSFITRKLREGLSPVFVAKYVDSSVEEIERRYAVAIPDVMRLVAG